jgi:selenocysteine lyase/cysteine desulfurase
MFGCPPQQVVLTTSATHGLNIAIKSLVGPGDRVVISGMEHNAVVRPLHALGAEINVACGRLFDREALLQDFRRLLTPDTKACIVTHVSNVFGWTLPVAEIAAMCRERGIPFVLDASQSAGILPISMDELGAAFVAMPGHKGLLGPHGTGLLFCGHDTKPILEGGTGSVSRQREMPDFLPDRLEAGTQNMPGAAGLLAGLQYLERRGLEEIRTQEQELSGLLVQKLRHIPGIQVFSGENQTGVVSFRAEDWDSVLLAERLAQAGFALRAGLHCAPLAHDTAGTLETGTIRVSPGPFSTRADVQALARTLKDLLESEKS